MRQLSPKTVSLPFNLRAQSRVACPFLTSHFGRALTGLARVACPPPAGPKLSQWNQWKLAEGERGKEENGERC